MHTLNEINVNNKIAIGNIILHKEIEKANCITGDHDFLIDKIRIAFKKAKRIDIIVAFLMESGVRLLSEDLKEAAERKVPIRILTGNYLT